MSIESLFDSYYERASIPARNTQFEQRQQGPFDIRQVEEDDEFRHLNHQVVTRENAAYCVWRHQDWMMGDQSMDVTHFIDGVALSMSIRYANDAVSTVKLSATRSDWMIPDPDSRLPYIFGRTDMEVWYTAKDDQLAIDRARLAYDQSNKHSFTVLGQNINKKSSAHLYRDVEYRAELDDGIRLVIDGKNPRKVNWRHSLSADDARALFEYAYGNDWLNGWEPVAKIVDIND